MKVYRDEVEFYGHPMVRSRHRNTIEVTRDPNLTISGDCIIGVRADKGLADLSTDVRDSIRADGSELFITIEVPPESFVVRAVGSRLLSLEDAHEMVLRKTGFISPRTLAIRADAAAKDIPRRMVESLRSPDCRGLLRIEVQV
ncbi:MAG: DUF371 domain-containing protein [Thaumarchaeota archaeon]|nr:DUF371 domain-containing protein [Nitrososphaerota archaeon]